MHHLFTPSSAVRRVWLVAVLVCVVVVSLPQWGAGVAHADYSAAQTVPNQQGGYNILPDVAVDEGGWVYATWVYVPGDFGISAIAYARGTLDAAGNIAWGRPIELSGRNGSTAPQIEIGSNGRVHLVYADRAGNINYLENTNNGDTSAWSGAQVLGSGFTPAVAVGSDNQVYVTWADIRNNVGVVAFRWRTASAGFGGERTFANAGVLARNNRIVVSGTGTDAIVHIVAEYKANDRAPFRVAYLRDRPNGAGASVRDLNSEANTSPGITPQIAIDPQTGALAVIWISERNDNFAVQYTQSTNGGGTWEGARMFGKSQNEWAFTPSLVLRNNTARIAANIKVWTGEGFADQTIATLTFDRSNGAVSGWRTLGASLSAFPQLAANSSRVVLLWSHTVGDNDVLQYSTDVVGGTPAPGPTVPPAPTPSPMPTPNPTPAPPVGPPAPNGQYAVPQFQAIWERADRGIAEGALPQQRSWLWGPQISSGFREPYRNSPDGARVVQYFEKSRMELNDPANGNVTNGLLVREMIEGRVQVADAEYVTTAPAEQAVAGDAIVVNANAPTYTSFRSVAFPTNPNRPSNRTGQTVTQVLARDGRVSENSALGKYNVVLGSYDGTLGHNIPRVFTAFFALRGLVYEGGYKQGQVIDQNFAVGLPLSEPYWARVKLGGVEKDVLIQVFERRVVTYTPDNPQGFQVEMGNVGQHYLRWRYAR